MNTSHTSWAVSWVGRCHRALVSGRRVRILGELLSSQIPRGASTLDVGCGDGTIGSWIAQRRPDISIEGVEVAARPVCRIPCSTFDGTSLPFADGTFDGCLLVDVLHHTDDVTVLLREAARVSRDFVLLKDHLCENSLDDATLRFMDWIGNRPHGVRLTFNYQSRRAWMQHFADCGLVECNWTTDVPLYPAPFALAVGRGLHFVAFLRKCGPEEIPPGCVPSALLRTSSQDPEF
jgi:SAM-dependent methyltransferase